MLWLSRKTLSGSHVRLSAAGARPSRRRRCARVSSGPASAFSFAYRPWITSGSTSAIASRTQPRAESSSAVSSQAVSALRSKRAVAAGERRRVLSTRGDRSALDRGGERAARPARGDVLDERVERLRPDVVRVAALDERATAAAKARSCAVWTSRYGWLPPLTDNGSGPRRRPAVSRSTASASPLWLNETMTTGSPPTDVVSSASAARRDAVDHGDGLGRGGRVVVGRPARPRAPRTPGRPDASMQLRAERMEAELERGDDPEVPAGTADAPEQVRLLGLARPDEPAVGGHELDGAQVVDGQPEAALEPPDAATEGQPGDAGVTDDADRADEPVRLGRDVKLAEQRAAVHPGGARRRIDRHAAHPRQVDDEAAVAGRVPGRAVAAGADGQLEVVVPARTGSPSRRRRPSPAGRCTAGRRSWTAFHSRRASS